MTAVAAWILASVATLAIVEYATHRWVMHRKGSTAYVRHTVFHHGRFYRGRFDRDPDPIAPHINIDLDVGYALMLGMPAWAGLLLCGQATGAAVVVAVISAHAATWTLAHREMHDPKGRWWAGSRWYRFLRDHHERHHRRPGTNFSVVFAPLLDLAMGTYSGPRKGPAG